MKETVKRKIGKMAIRMGKKAVGKCMIPGMFDPKIPDLLKKEQKEGENSR